MSGIDRDDVTCILKEIMVKFIKLARMGVDLKLDFRIGVLHSYPNGELLFENASESIDE